MVREGFLGMATGFTVDDALSLAELLTDGGILDPVDVRTAVQLRLEETFEGHIDDRARVVGMEVVRRRSERRDARARRATQRVEADRATLERAHELGSWFAVRDLLLAGFRIVRLEDPFIKADESGGGGDSGWWRLVAERPNATR